MNSHTTPRSLRSVSAAIAVLAAASVIALASCAKPASDAELAQAYTFYIEAPNTLKKVVSTANTENFIAESVSNPDGSYIRSTEIDQAAKTSKITATFKDFHPADAKTVTLNGEVVMTSLGNVFSVNGSIEYKGINLKKLTFKNASLRQTKTDAGDVTFKPVDGSVQADKREIGVEEFFMGILQ